MVSVLELDVPFNVGLRVKIIVLILIAINRFCGTSSRYLGMYLFYFVCVCVCACAVDGAWLPKGMMTVSFPPQKPKK